MHYGGTTSDPLPPPPPRRPPAAAAAVASVAMLITVTVGVSLGLYGGGGRVALGPGSSRAVTVGSVASFWVGHMEVRHVSGQGVILYQFHVLPELNRLRNWTKSNTLTLSPCDRRGFSLWLNRGSSIRLTWTVFGGDPEKVKVVVFKGKSQCEHLEEHPTKVDATGSNYGGEAVLRVEDDGSYYVGAANRGSAAAGVMFAGEISSAVHDVAAAASACSIGGGGCKMKLLLGRVNYAVLDYPPATLGQVPRKTWSVALSFELRLAAFLAILGTLSVALWLILRYLLSSSEDSASDGTAAVSRPAAKEAPPYYGAMDEEGTSNSSEERRASSDDLYDGKICVICFESQKNCFFTPCGHCVACYSCAKRLMEEERRACPICRRLIHKARRLPSLQTPHVDVKPQDDPLITRKVSL